MLNRNVRYDDWLSRNNIRGIHGEFVIQTM
jgi:hypothetical protein